MTANIRKKRKLIIIGGASGVGKSTLANLLNAQKIAKHKRIHEFAFDITKETGVGIETIFSRWDFYMTKIIERTINYTVKNGPIISDVHFAVQTNADTIFLIQGKVDDDHLLREDFTPAFKAEDLTRIVSSNIGLILVLITCSTDELISRRIKMFQQNLPVRSLNKDIIKKECAAEMEIYMSLVDKLGQSPNIFTNPDNQFDTFFQKMLSLINNY